MIQTPLARDLLELFNDPLADLTTYKHKNADEISTFCTLFAIEQNNDSIASFFLRSYVAPHAEKLTSRNAKETTPIHM